MTELPYTGNNEAAFWGSRWLAGKLCSHIINFYSDFNLLPALKTEKADLVLSFTFTGIQRRSRLHVFGLITPFLFYSPQLGIKKPTMHFLRAQEKND